MHTHVFLASNPEVNITGTWLSSSNYQVNKLSANDINGDADIGTSSPPDGAGVRKQSDVALTVSPPRSRDEAPPCWV